MDDDESKINQTIHGVKVLGKTGDLGKFVEEFNINEVIIAIPSAKGSRIRDILNKNKNVEVDTNYAKYS